MARLTNTKIKNTYVSLLKVADNGQLDAALQDITDGAGNVSGIQLNTGGDLTASGTISFGSLKDSGENITITKFVDAADGIGSNNNDTTIPTSAAVSAYVASQITLEDLDFAGDSGTGAVDLDSQTLSIVGTANEITTAAGAQTLTIGLPSTIHVNVQGDLTGNVTATSVLVDGVTATTQSIGDNSTKVATTAYVDAAITAEGLDFAGDSGTGTIDLDSEVFTIAGTANEIETSATGNSLIVGLPSNVTIGNDLTVTGAISGTLSTAAQTNITSVGTLTGLSVNGNGTISNATNPKLEIIDTTLPNTLLLQSLNGDSIIGTSTNTSLFIKTNDTTRMTIGNSGDVSITGDLAVDTNTLYVDSANNRVGVGTASPTYKMEIDGGSAETRLRISTTGTDADEAGIILANSGKVGFNDGIQIAHGAGVTTFKDLAGEAQMVIDVTNSRVGIGTSSPATKLHVDGGTSAGLTLSGTTDSYINFGDADPNVGQIYYDHSGNFMSFRTNDNNAMRIDSSGNVGIGATNPSDKLVVIGDIATTATMKFTGDSSTPSAGAFVHRPASNTLALGTASTERMRITSGGNVAISAGGLTSGTITVGRNGNFSSLGAVSDGNGTTTAFLNAYSSASGTSNAIIYTNGTYGSATNTYGAIISDQRYKENIADTSPKLDKIMQVKVRNFNLIGDDLKQIGVIAQEVEQIFPSLVYERELTENVETIDEEGNVTSEIKLTGETAKAVKDSIFTYILLKAVQEQQEIINDLKARIEILENK